MGGCSSHPDQFPPPAANDRFINWAFDSLEDNIIVDLSEHTLHHILKRCDELRDLTRDVEEEKHMKVLPEISKLKVEEARQLYSPQSVWIGKIVYHGKEVYLEITIGKEWGKGERVVDLESMQTSKGSFRVFARADLKKRKKGRRKSSTGPGFKIEFQWDDEGDDFKLNLISETFDTTTTTLQGKATVNDHEGTFELVRAMVTHKKNIQHAVAASKSNLAVTQKAASYSQLAFSKTSRDLQEDLKAVYEEEIGSSSFVAETDDPVE